MAKNISRRQFLHSSLTGAAVLGTGIISWGATQCDSPQDNIHQKHSKVYFVDSSGGNDAHDGLSTSSAWKSLGRLENAQLNPGDTIRFKRGSAFDRCFTIRASGKSEAPILITDYGDRKSVV